MIHFPSSLANQQAKALQLKKKKNDPKVNANNRKRLTLGDKLSLFHISQGNTTVSWQMSVIHITRSTACFQC